MFQKLTFLLLWLTIFTMPFMNSFMIPELGSINRVASVAVLVVAVFTAIIQKRIKKIPAIYLLMFLFLFWIGMTSFWAIDQDGAILKVGMFAQLFLLSWVIYEYTNTGDQLNHLLKAYVYGCLVISLMTIYQYLTMSSAFVGSRFFLEAYNPNNLGTIIAFGLPLVFYLILKGQKRFLLYFPIALFMMFILGSRTVLIAFAIILISTLWMLFRYRVRFRKLIVMSLIILGIFVYNQIPQENLDRLSTVGDELSSGTLNNRTIIWDAGVEVLKDNSVFGVGSNSFGESVMPHIGLGSSAHNTYLSVAVETGIIGLVLFITMILLVFYYAWKSDKGSKMRWLALTLFITWIAVSLVGHAEVQKYTWIVFSFVITMYKLKYNPVAIQAKEKPKRKRRFKRYRIVWAK